MGFGFRGGDEDGDGAGDHQEEAHVKERSDLAPEVFADDLGKSIDDGSDAEDQRHDEDRSAAVVECVNDAQRAQCSQSAS